MYRRQIHRPPGSDKDRITLIGGLEHATPGGHFSIHSFLSGVRQIDAKSMPDANVTLDQYAAEHVVGLTQRPLTDIPLRRTRNGRCKKVSLDILYRLLHW
jgi:hypothetical protein